MENEDVFERLSFSKHRLDELLILNNGDFAGANQSERQQLIQEFFFHLIGTVEILAQFINEKMELGIDREKVSISNVIKKVNNNLKLKNLLNSIYANPQKDPLPQDPYAVSGIIYRAYNYRHQVTHRGKNTFLFRVGSSPPASFVLDPRNQNLGHSERSVQDEMNEMYEIIKNKCEEITSILQKDA